MKRILGSLVLAAAVALPAAAQPAFGLTDAQKEALRGAVASEKDAILAVARAEESARTALRAAIAAVPYDEAGVAAAAAPVAAADAELSALRARLYAKCFAVLTPVQALEANALLALATERIGGAVLRFVRDDASIPPQLLAEEKEARAALLAAIRRPVPDEAAARAASAAVSEVDVKVALSRVQTRSETMRSGSGR